MSARRPSVAIRAERGVGLVEVMVSVIIGMLLVLVIYQIYEVSEGQKRTITSGSDAQQNASVGIHLLARDLSVAGNGIASSVSALVGCPFNSANLAQSVFPLPVFITTGASDNVPDTISVFYGGSSTLSTPAQLTAPSTPNTYQVASPVGFSDKDVIVAAQGPTCTVSTIDVGGVSVNPANGLTTLSYTPVAGNIGATYSAPGASIVNLGKSTCAGGTAQQATVGRIEYSVDASTQALRTQNVFDIVCGTVVNPATFTVNPVVSDVVNLKALYGLDLDGDGIVDSWQDSNGAWIANLLAPATLPAARQAALRNLVAVRIAIVTRSEQYEKDPVTPSPITMFDGAQQLSMTLSTDDQHYRYKVLETVIPLRNVLYN
jgi:type IV pilus assembly protein PilW